MWGCIAYFITSYTIIGSQTSYTRFLPWIPVVVWWFHTLAHWFSMVIKSYTYFPMLSGTNNSSCFSLLDSVIFVDEGLLYTPLLCTQFGCKMGNKNIIIAYTMYEGSSKSLGTQQIKKCPTLLAEIAYLPRSTFYTMRGMGQIGK